MPPCQKRSAIPWEVRYFDGRGVWGDMPIASLEFRKFERRASNGGARQLRQREQSPEQNNSTTSHRGEQRLQENLTKNHRTLMWVPGHSGTAGDKELEADRNASMGFGGVLGKLKDELECIPRPCSHTGGHQTSALQVQTPEVGPPKH